MKEYKLSGVKYWGIKEKRFDIFKHFDIIVYRDIINAYLNTSNDLKPKHESFGWNERPINSNIDKWQDDKSWGGFDPLYFNIDPTNETVVMAKADTISMDMKNVGKDWKYFLHLHLPYELINEYMTNMHDNEDVSIARKFINEVERSEKGWENENWKKIEKEYDKQYPETSTYTDFYETHTVLKWKQDFDIRQYISIKQNGLLFPICYNDKHFMLRRGTHRAVLLAMTQSDVPIFLQYPYLSDKTLKEYSVKSPKFFGNKSLNITVKPESKSLDFFLEDENSKNFIGSLL